MPDVQPLWMRRLVQALVFTGIFLPAIPGASAQARSTSGLEASKLDIYGGYGFWDPIDSDDYGKQFPRIDNPNATASLSLYFTRHFGVQVEGGYFSLDPTLNAAGTCNAVPCSPRGQRVYTAEAGPVFRFPIGRFTPFAHVLGGGERINGPYYNPLQWSYGVTGGIGVDYVIPAFNNRLAFRPIQADYQYTDNSWGPVVLPAAVVGGEASINAVKLSAGLTLRLGSIDSGAKEHRNLTLSCSADPSSVYVGDPVNVTATPDNLDPKKPSFYQWNSTGGQVTQLTDQQGAAQVTTAELAPGDYVVTGKLSQGKHVTECTSSFSVKAIEPPTLTCSSSPATIQSGGIAVIKADGTSLANRKLTYSFTADYGLISGSGNQVQLASAGVTAPVITVTCNVVDDLGKTAQATTKVSITVPKAAVLPPLTATETLCGVSFERDKRRPVRVDNEAKACLDDVALSLQRQPDAKLVVIGDYGKGEDTTQGAERSLNVQQYLTEEKGIDPGRIDARYGTPTGRSVALVLVPAGATFDDKTAIAFDPTSVKRVGQAYGKPGQHVIATKHVRRHHKKKAAKKAAAQ